jgi:hypothetical protein
MDVAAEVSASKRVFKSRLSLSVPMSCRNRAQGYLSEGRVASNGPAKH